MSKTRKVKRTRHIDRRKLTRLSRKCGMTPKELYDLRSGEIITVTDKQAQVLIQRHYAVPVEEAPDPVEDEPEVVEEKTADPEPVVTVDDPEEETVDTEDRGSWFAKPNDYMTVDDDESEVV